jgi:hypothetical protein
LLPAGAFAGWDLHPLESAAFPRRTPQADSHGERRSRTSRRLAPAASPTWVVFHRLHFETGAFEQTSDPKAQDLSSFVLTIGRPFAGETSSNRSRAGSQFPVTAPGWPTTQFDSSAVNSPTASPATPSDDLSARDHLGLDLRLRAGQARPREVRAGL